MRKKQIYLTWDAYRAGFIVTANALEKLYFQEDIQIDKVFYLHNATLSTPNYDGWKAFLNEGALADYEKKYKLEDKKVFLEDIKRCWEAGKNLACKPAIQNKKLDIKEVTNYQSIFDAVLLFLQENISVLTNFQLHINVSPGTPQMHVVWLMLNAAGYLPPNTKLWGTQIIKTEDNKRKNLLNAIKFKPKTFLSEVLASSSKNVQSILINPNNTKSSKRKEVEGLLKLYGSIPNEPILILGERGTGKSTYVRTILRECYAEKETPFVEIACGTLSEELMRSELFGHEQGAFTGATKGKNGILAQFENKGILFLDEIHDLSKKLQRLLIQVLQTGEYFPIGSEKKKKTNPRIIIASNFSYEKLRDELLDADFFDRVVRFVVEVPPLRECKEDLEHYWKKTWDKQSTFDKAPPVLWNKKIQSYLEDSPLNGNFRDLQKLISYLMAFMLREQQNLSNALKLAIEQFEKWSSKPKVINDYQEKYFLKDTTYRSIVEQFNCDLVAWAKDYYGGLDEASKVLDRKKSTLYQYLRGGKNSKLQAPKAETKKPQKSSKADNS